MKPLSIAAMTFLLTSVAGCSLVFHEEEHPSQGVYQVELASAKHFMHQANKLESEMLTFCKRGIYNKFNSSGSKPCCLGWHYKVKKEALRAL